MRELPIEPFLYDRKSLFAWTVKMHNMVNIELEKKEWTVEEAWTYYREGKFVVGDNQKNTNMTLFMICMILLLIVIFMFIAYRMFRRFPSLSPSPYPYPFQKSK
jgi:hypothetical protein